MSGYRWRESEGIYPENVNNIADQGIYTGLAMFTFILGIGFVFVGIRQKQLWLAIWGAMLSIVSIAYGVALYYGVG